MDRPPSPLHAESPPLELGASASLSTYVSLPLLATHSALDSTSGAPAIPSLSDPASSTSITALGLAWRVLLPPLWCILCLPRRDSVLHVLLQLLLTVLLARSLVPLFRTLLLPLRFKCLFLLLLCLGYIVARSLHLSLILLPLCFSQRQACLYRRHCPSYCPMFWF